MRAPGLICHPSAISSRATKDKTETQPIRRRDSTNRPARKLGGEGSLNPRVSPAAVLKAEASTSRQICREGKRSTQSEGDDSQTQQTADVELQDAPEGMP